MPASRRSVRKCFDEWFDVLPNIVQIESPWCFLCMAALIDYLSSAAYPGLSPWKRYRSFIKDYFPAKYRKFTYKSGKQDLPAQMYYVLRNGLVHSFSLFPDATGIKHGGRVRSIVLAHRSNAGGRRHLDIYDEAPASDAAYFIAEDFFLDTKKAAYKLWKAAKRGIPLERSILAKFSAQPPIAWNPDV